jgi:TRAP-type C4-dicarboxylate transport system substrate-binding protein
MNFATRYIAVRAAAATGAIVLSLPLLLGAAAAQDKTYTMKITLPTLNDPSHVFAKNYAAAVEKDSGGRIKPEIYPASQLGSIPRQIEGVQFGAIQCAVIPPEFFVGVDERFEVMAAPGLVDSMAHGERLAADPAVLKVMLGLGAQKGLHGVALFDNAAQSVISKAPIRHLADFKGKKIRVLASPFQTQAIERLGATPVAMTLGDVMPAMQQGTIDGAVGGIVVWTPMHYVDVTKYVRDRPARGLCDRRDQQELVRFTAAGFAENHRHRRRRPADRHTAGGDRHFRKSAQGLDRRRRRVDQPAVRRAGRHDENIRQRGHRRVEAQAAAERGLQDRHRGGAADAITPRNCPDAAAQG